LINVLMLNGEPMFKGWTMYQIMLKGWTVYESNAYGLNGVPNNV
jgi:hypothetical protein